jgi:hypothetical protein
VKKVISIALSLLTLMSQVGYALNTHYCGGEAMKTSFTLAASELSCGMMDEETTNCEEKDQEQSSFQEKPCCENKHQLFQSENEYKKPVEAQNFTPDFAIAFLLVSNNLLATTPINEQLFVPTKSPPLLDRDRQVLFQTFLI